MVDEGWGRKAVEFATLSEPGNCESWPCITGSASLPQTGCWMWRVGPAWRFNWPSRKNLARGPPKILPEDTPGRLRVLTDPDPGGGGFFLACPANERLRHAHPGVGMFIVEAPVRHWRTAAAVTDSGGRADMQRASSRSFAYHPRLGRVSPSWQRIRTLCSAL